MKNYTYPRVDIKTIAKIHNTAAPEAEDTTVLFMPILADKGPMNEIVKIHSLEEFITIFGEMDGIQERVGKLTAFNIMNWLTAGGTLYVVRLGSTIKDDCQKRVYTVKYPTSEKNVFEYYVITGKDYGAYINDYKFTVVKDSNKSTADEDVPAHIIIKNGGGRIVERIYFRIPKDKPTEASSKESKEASDEESTEAPNETPTEIDTKTIHVASEYIESIRRSKTEVTEVKGSDGFVGDEFAFAKLLEKFWVDQDNDKIQKDEDSKPKIISIDRKLKGIHARHFLENPLPTPIDLLMDAGYPKSVKVAMGKFVMSNNSDEPGIRPDICAYIDLYDDNKKGEKIAEALQASDNDEDAYPQDENIFYFWQSFTISDAVFADGKDMTVGPSYFLSKIVPANDIANGIQFAAAGTRRAELTDVVKMSENPLPDTKETLFNNHINYAEEDSKGYYFMSQRTSSKLNTALSHINCARVTCRMVHEINALARDYLFEFNDATTLQNMRSVLNKYVTNWIANRTLSYGEVDVAKNALSDEAVDVTLNIKFTGTIEVISIKLIIE